jgi:hypothetical protein
MQDLLRVDEEDQPGDPDWGRFRAEAAELMRIYQGTSPKQLRPK